MDDDKPQERIDCAAIKHGDGRVFSVPSPGRHHNVCSLMHELNVWDRDSEEHHVQGFVTDRGRFVDREEGRLIALRAGQIIRRCGGDQHRLYSENLW